MSRLSRYCEGVMEATWLTAVVCVPLFLATWGESAQSEKNYLLRSLAIVLLTAWVIKAIAGGGFFAGRVGLERGSLGSFFKTPLVPLTAILALVWIVATVFSLDPWISFWGPPSRRDGTYTHLCCFLFFAAMAGTIRSHQQVRRIITLVILTSFPICLYGIGQRFSIEPIIFNEGGDFRFRVGSTLVNAVFLAAYLIMVLPLTLARAIQSVSALQSAGTDRPIARFVQPVIWGTMAVLQIWAIVFTVSRGPFLGLVVGSVVRFLLFSIYWRRRWRLFAAIETGVIVVAIVALFTGSAGPSRKVAERPEIERFAEIVHPEVGSVSTRVEIWKMAAQASRFAKVVQDCDGHHDSLSRIRYLIGYGPEHVWPVCRLHRARAFNDTAGQEILDRIHNDFWDTLVTTGAAGLLAYLSLTFMIGYQTCRWLGLMTSSRRKWIFWSLFLCGGALGMIGLAAWRGIGFVGVGLRFGSSMGLIAFLGWVFLKGDFDRPGQGLPAVQALTVVGLLSGLLAHLIEVSFSFDVETTLLYFWIYMALLVVVGHRLRETESSSIPLTSRASSESLVPAQTEPRPRLAGRRASGSGARPRSDSAPAGWRSWRAELKAGVVVGLVLANVGTMLIYQNGASSTIQTLINSFTRLPVGNGAFAWSLPVFMLLTWLLFAASLTFEFRPSAGPARALLHSWMATLGISGAIAGFCWLIPAAHRARVVELSRTGFENLAQFLAGYTFIVDFHYGATLVLILVLATLLVEAERVPDSPPNRVGRLVLFVALVLGFGAITVIYATNMRWSKAGIMMNGAEYFKRSRQWSMAAAVCEASIRSAPAADNRYVALSEILGHQATDTKDPEARRALFLKADQALQAGGRLNPLDSNFLWRRGNLHIKWAQAEENAERKSELAKKAIAFHEQTAIFDPGNFDVWNRIAYLQLMILRSPEEAHRALARAVNLYRGWPLTYALLADVFFNQGEWSQSRADRETFFRSAATNYQRALELVGIGDISATSAYAAGLWKSHVRVGRLEEAVAAYQKALSVYPRTNAWRNEEALARLFNDVKDRTNALAHLDRAVNLAPEDKKPGLLKLKSEILARP